MFQDKMREALKNVALGKEIFIADMRTAMWRISHNPDYNLKIGRDMYQPILNG